MLSCGAISGCSIRAGKAGHKVKTATLPPLANGRHSPLYRAGTDMSTKTQILISLIGLGLVDIVIPIPIAATILIYVTLKRPSWFAEMVRDIYGA
jgi:hypothetical protein